MIADQVVRHARLAGDRTAVLRGEERLSYTELNERSGRLAARLSELGIGPERVAGVLLDRDLDLPVALLAVLRTGAAYLPLDPDHPDERIAFQLDDARADVLLTNVRLADRAHLSARAIVHIEEIVNVAMDNALTHVRVPVHAHGIAYVMHTSGSTGRSKPVAITHGALRQHAAAVGALLELVPGDRVLQHASVAFDVSAEELYPTWCAGATVVMAPASGLPAPAFERLIEAQAVTVVNLPSGYFGQWARHVVERGSRPPACLRLVVIGSEAADGATVAAWLRHTGVPVVNAYGVTEATITTTAYRPAPAPVRPLVPIGRPLSGAEVHLLDADLRPVAGGDTGELCIGGAGLARGYHGRPALTAERFVPHPAAPGERLYRTGDLARRLPDGALELLGRADEQVKVRGHRVEPAEVAAALRAHPDVEDAHVVHHPLQRGGCLTGYVIPRDPARAPAASELRAWLRRRLPGFMVPDAFVLLDRLPRTVTGKIDRRGLPLPARVAPAAAYEPPVGELERAVAGVWQEVLGVERVGRRDDFLALSGNSLLAIQLLNRLHAATGAEVSLGELLAAPTVAELARLVGRPNAARPAPPSLTPGPRRRLAPLSAQQEQLWLVSKLAPESVAYNVQTSVRIAGEVRAEPLERALTELVRRHEILRTTFEEVDGRPLQVIHAPWPVTVERIDLREHPRSERPSRAEAAIERELARPFDLGRLPLLRWTLLQHDDAEFELLVVEHHLLTDGTSFATALREVTALYDAFAAGEEPVPADPPLQYADYARWQRAAADSPALRAQLAHWSDKLAGA
ncbi:MAG TPA: amino acid adenylation domain-containing protein, partial [Candidatus Dormibacteraeota bacterium]|nr:amino acid adenylation domain-containing protein [Candidatus Dormibacteraeota bacterium]